MIYQLINEYIILNYIILIICQNLCTLICLHKVMADYTGSFLDGGLSFVAPVVQRSFANRMLTIFEPFTFPLWGCLWILFTVTAVVFWYLDKDGNVESLGFHMFIVWVAFAQVDFWRPSGVTARALAVLFAFFTMTLISFYTAMLTVRFENQSTRSTIENILQVHDGVCVHEDGDFPRLMAQLYPTVTHIPFLGNASNSLADHMLSGNCGALLYDHVVNAYWEASRCDVAIIPSSEFRMMNYVFYSADTKHANEVLQSISYFISKFREESQIDEMFNRWFKQTSACPSDLNDDQIGIPDVFGGLVFFTLFLFALPLAKHFYNSSQESMHEIQELESKGEIVSSWSKMKIAAKAMRRMSSLPPTEGRTEAVATKESLRWDHLPSRESTAVQVYGPRTRQAQLDNSHDDLLVDETLRAFKWVCPNV